ncbi:hypothetical protein ACJMK2_031668 [Sinanodonta woodiana]|uniref:Uncharacterized protein n=1 Tax=Sinanodonta woodiana TaxID=1069815 RepID=A0ABD3X3D3_SINWO
MIGWLIWMQWNERRGLKAVQRLVLEASSFTIDSGMKQLQTSIVKKEGLCQSICSTLVGKSQSELKLYSSPDNTPACDTPYNFAMAVPIFEDDKPGLACENIVASKESNAISIQTLSQTSDKNTCDLLEDCPTVCILGSAASNAAIERSQLDQVSYYPYAKVKKGPRSTFTHNNLVDFSSLPDGECSDGYEMVNFTLGNESRKMLQNLEIVSVSAILVNVSLQEKYTAKNNYGRDSKDDDGYETCGTVEHMTFVEQVKVSGNEGAMTGKSQEPKNCTIHHCAMHIDYADIDVY